MSLRPVTLLFAATAAIWLTIAAPLSAAAETFMVVVNANNRVSGPNAELREVVRQLYLKEETRWPDDLPSLPIARPSENAVSPAFAETVLGLSPTKLESYWAETGAKPPKAIGPVRDLLRQISRNKGAFSIVAAAEAKKLPAKVRVLFEFTTDAPAIDEPLWSREDVLAYVKANNRLLERRLAYYTKEHRLLGRTYPWEPNALIGQIEIVRVQSDSVLADITYKYGDVSRGGRVWDGQFPFHLKWVGEDLHFVGHGEAALAALSPTTEPAPGQAESFDGDWLFEIVDQSAPNEPDRHTVRIVDNTFSVEVGVNGRRGTISGEINTAGELYAFGQLKSIGRNYDRVDRLELALSAPMANGMFHATTTIDTPLGAFDYEINLTSKQRPLQQETAAMSPSTEPTLSQTGSFDGEWVLQFEQLDGPFFGGTGASSRAVTQTNIVGNEFSAHFKGSIWQGKVSGRIDESGKLVASGWAVRKQYQVANFNIKADFIDGAFRAEFEALNVYGDRAICEIALTPAG